MEIYPQMITWQFPFYNEIVNLVFIFIIKLIYLKLAENAFHTSYPTVP